MTALEEFQERVRGWALAQVPNLTVNVNSYNPIRARCQGHGYVPLHLTSNKKDKHVNLLYVPDQRNGHVGHFAWIKHLSRLVSLQLSKKKTAKCLHYLHTSEKLAQHTVDCERLNNSAVVLPAEGKNRLKFENYNNKERVPMVVYADLECVLEKQDKKQDTSSEHKYQKHSVFSIGYYASCEHFDIGYRSHRGENCVQWFVNELHDLAKRAKTVFAANVPMANLTPAEIERFKNAKCCHVCKQPFERDDNRVRDHCHLTGRFRGSAHFACNLNSKQVYVVPVVFHNLSGYDSHFIIMDVATAFEGEINVLPVTKDTYISFTKHVNSTRNEDNQRCVQLRFIDFYKFLSTSLEKLASYLGKSELRVTRTEFGDLSTEDFELLTRKGVFPYEYVNSVDKLLETSLPPREAFYSSLTGESVTESEYAHTTNVYGSDLTSKIWDCTATCI
ncbi:uncharacterized protein LOC109862692 [Pseudomyrmex gracilis]|uniref:uncharacterized protein LOC109862692 n=1 Tax=Pseudomyrmex gracilis TaxID=219809 RepID=UPI000994D060|nr:uncharacterized protein LOC109862692 [Pseudomyrmex gracilis]